MSKVSIEGNASGTGTLTIAAPNTNSNFTLTLPTNTGDIVTTGTTTGISASALSTGTLATARLPAGTVLQVVSTTKTDTFSTASTSFVDVTGFSVSITPTSASSKILVFGNLTSSAGLQAVITGDAQLVRDSTAIGNGSSGLATHNSANSSFTVGWPFSYLDSPATTSATTYKVQVRGDGATFYINTPSARTLVGSSTITVMEIAA
jgi:hypothetical protein